MQISSHELARCADYLSSELKTIRDKVEFYATDELKKRKGSNFVLEIPTQDDIFLIKISRILSEKENLLIDNDLAKDFIENYKTSESKFNEFDALLDEISKKENGSMNDAFFYLPFSRWFDSLYKQITTLYLLFLDKFEVKDIVADKEKYEKILKDAIAKEDALSKLITNAKNKSDELLLKLEQNVSDYEIKDIKEYYAKAKNNTRKIKIVYTIFYYGLSGVLFTLLILIFFNAKNIFPEMNKVSIVQSVILCSLTGLMTFLINDFRKKLNITKSIFDEFEQKEIVVDTYTNLLSRISDFEPETKKKYHEKIIQNIIDTLLLIRNHGYLSKTLNQDNPNLAPKLVEEIGNIIGKK